MAHKKYQFYCGCENSEYTQVTYTQTVNGYFCPECHDPNRKPTHAHNLKCRVLNLEYVCEECGKTEARQKAGATVITEFICRECKTKRFMESQTVKRREKALAKKEAARLEQERQAKRVEMLEAKIKSLELELSQTKTSIANDNTKPEAPDMAICPTCRAKHRPPKSAEFNTKETKWLYCPKCASRAKVNAAIEATISPDARV